MALEITGRIIDRQSRRGVPELRVEASILVLPHDEFASRANTNSEGIFRMEVEEELLLELFQDRVPEVFFKVFHGDELVASTEGSVVWRLDDPPTEIVIEVDLPTEAPTHSAPMECAHVSCATFERA